MGNKKTIGILTGGGDCPGLNAAIRAVSKTAIHDCGMEVVGFEDGFEGLLQERILPLDWLRVSNIISRGGTILGTSNRIDPFRFKGEEGTVEDHSGRVAAICERHAPRGLIIIGGDGTMTIARQLSERGLPVIGVPKTIDNDLRGTDVTIGFDSAREVASDAIDRVHTTAESHHRAMIVETMGRYAGWIALESGIASGGDIILLPEIPFRCEIICDELEKRGRTGKRFSIVVVSEGAREKGGKYVISERDEEMPEPVRLGGIGHYLSEKISEITGLDTRVVMLGHVQRGGSPTAADRILATLLGSRAAKLAAEGGFGQLVALRRGDIVPVPLKETGGGPRTVPLDSPLLDAARAVGTKFGD